MATPTKYTYTKEINSDRLSQEIRASSISIALDHITTVDTSIDVWFKDVLSSGDQTTLAGLVTSHAPLPLVPIVLPTEVVTQLEKDDKILRTICAHATADANGVATINVVVPGIPFSGEGRYIAYGDAEFETRHIWDRVTKIAVDDPGKLVAILLGQALFQAELYNDGETPPGPAVLTDQQVSGFLAFMGTLMGLGRDATIAEVEVIFGDKELWYFPLYPYVEYYSDTEVSGDGVYGGMTMTYQYGTTEVQPVGGYAWIPAGFRLVIECTKGNGATGAGCKLSSSIDWAKPKV